MLTIGLCFGGLSISLSLKAQRDDVLVCLGRSQVTFLILAKLLIALAFTQKCPSLDNRLHFHPSHDRWKLAEIPGSVAMNVIYKNYYTCYLRN